MSYVYLIHFDRKIGRPQRPGNGYTASAGHYIGYTEDLAARVQAHRIGNGARLLEVAKERGVGWRVARVWEGDRKVERRIKRRKDGPKLCPICNPETAARWARTWPELSDQEIDDLLIAF